MKNIILFLLGATMMMVSCQRYEFDPDYMNLLDEPFPNGLIRIIFFGSPVHVCTNGMVDKDNVVNLMCQNINSTYIHGGSLVATNKVNLRTHLNNFGISGLNCTGKSDISDCKVTCCSPGAMPNECERNQQFFYLSCYLVQTTSTSAPTTSTITKMTSTTTTKKPNKALHCNVDGDNSPFKLKFDDKTTGLLSYRLFKGGNWMPICHSNFYHPEAKTICRTICNDSSISDLYSTSVYWDGSLGTTGGFTVSCPDNANVIGDCTVSRVTGNCRQVYLQCGYPIIESLPARTLPTLNCHHTDAVVTFDVKDSYDEIKSIDAITLKDKPPSGCNDVNFLNSSHFTKTVPYQNCMTAKHNNTHITYEFTIIRMIPLNETSNTSNKPSYMVPLSCSVKKNNNAATSGDTSNPDVTNPPIGGPIDVDMTLTLFKDAAYTEELRVTDKIAIGAEIYIKAAAPLVTGTSVNLQNCWSTAVPDKNAVETQSLIANKCPVLEGLQIAFYSASETRFHFKAFSTDTSSTSTTLYIHCEAVRCIPSGNCLKECGATSIKRRRRSATDSSSKSKKVGSVVIGGKNVYGVVGGHKGPFKIVVPKSLASQRHMSLFGLFLAVAVALWC